jgi:hypothetical protein
MARPEGGRGGSDLGRAAIDWEAAFAVYASLPPERRSYGAVAARFGISTRTVETHGLRDRWRERSRRIDREATVVAERRIGKARAEQIAEVLGLIEASLNAYREQLRDGEVRVRPADLSPLVKLLNELSGEEPGPAEAETAAGPAESLPSVEHMAAVIAALHEAIGDPERGVADHHHDHDDDEGAR